MALKEQLLIPHSFDFIQGNMTRMSNHVTAKKSYVLEQERKYGYSKLRSRATNRYTRIW